jgi:hypothetical protein
MQKTMHVTSSNEYLRQNMVESITCAIRKQLGAAVGHATGVSVYVVQRVEVIMVAN